MQQQNNYHGPLAGLNVIDFGHYYAGPMAAMLLADQGANVIRIVRPGEPELPSQQYRLLNRNKKLLTLDLKTGEGKAQALSLIESADVLIENFRPGVMKRLGLDYASIKDTNPGLVYLSLPGFASDDKERAHIQAWESVLSAAAGLYTEISHIRKFLGYPPVYSWIPLCSVYGATTGVIAAISALIAREEHGCGNIIETPLVEAGTEGFGMNFFLTLSIQMGGHIRTLDANTVREKHETWEAQKSNRYLPEDTSAEQLRKLIEAHRASFDTPLCHFYPCKDGREIFIFSAPGAMLRGLMKALGIDRQLLKEGFTYAGFSTGGLNNNLNSGMDKQHTNRLKQLISEALLCKPAEEWESLLAEKSPVVMNRTREEWLRLEPMLKSGVFTKMNDGNSELTVAGRFVDVTGPGGVLVDGFKEAESITVEQAHEIFKHRIKVCPHASKQPSHKKGDLLKDLKILDLSNGLAGPTSAFTLAQYGADVIVLGPPMSNQELLTIEVNQGKRSLLADLKTAPGQEILRRLVSWADVVVHNTLDNVSQRLGISHEQLHAINPNIVSCQVSCLGGSRRGGWELRPGFDPIAQIVSGMMSDYGTFEEPHMHGQTITTDNLGGFGLAFSAVLGVYQQRKTGHAGEGRCSLARVCNYIQLPYMIAENGKCDWGEAKGQLALGDHWWQRLYQCADSWIYIGAREDQSSTLAEVITGKCDAEETMLEAMLVKQDCTYWQQRLDAAQIACHEVMNITDLCDRADIRRVSQEAADEIATGRGEILCYEDHPCGMPIIVNAQDWVRVGEERSWKRLSPAMRTGYHSKEILKELGYADTEIEELFCHKVVHEYPQGLVSNDEYFYGPES